MEDLVIAVGIGFLVFMLGIFLLKIERRKFSESVTTEATVVTYNDYIDLENGFPNTMYTMVVEYQDKSGNKIQAREQSSCTSRKYTIGTVISITYSCKKPDFFVITGDHSRIIIFYGMIVVGFLMMFGLGWALLQRL